MQAPSKDSERIVRVLGALRGKWTIQILCELRHGPVRLGQLKRSIPTASKKALTSSLRWLEVTQLIVRRDLTKSILHVEYELDDRMKEPLGTLLALLADWASLLPDVQAGSGRALKTEGTLVRTQSRSPGVHLVCDRKGG